MTKLYVANLGAAKSEIGRSVKNVMIQHLYERKKDSIGIHGSPSDTTRGIIAQLS